MLCLLRTLSCGVGTSQIFVIIMNKIKCVCACVAAFSHAHGSTHNNKDHLHPLFTFMVQV